MTKQTYIKVNGVWKPCTSVWQNVGGTWKKDVMPHVRAGGAWKECMLYDPYAPVDGNEFTWNGLTYKVVVKDYGSSGKLAWLDRNLGASRVATSRTDSLAYGDYYQWGRLTDGHEDKNSGETSTLSSTDVPGHSNFITRSSGNWDWRDPQNHNLWQGVDGINNPSPPGWRVPTVNEFSIEINTWTDSDHTISAYESSLKLPCAGQRSASGGSIQYAGSRGFYWSMTQSSAFEERSYKLEFTSGYLEAYSNGYRAFGYPVRCIRSDV